jgi:hypothetical protein
VADLPVLKAGPVLALRKERVDVPELSGAVIVRGLMASEAFAISALRQQAVRRLREAQAEYAQAVDQAQGGPSLPEPPPSDLDFAELRDYGRYVAQMLACSVTGESGLALYTADEWELVGQHHPGVIERLQVVAERLSGLNTGDVSKNSPPSPN